MSGSGRGGGLPGDGSPGSGPGEEEITGGFHRRPGGVSARFTAAQAGIVRSLVSQVAELVGGRDDKASTGPGPAGPGEPVPGAEDLAAIFGVNGPTSPPEDPVLARLFPDAYRDDPAAAGEFRKYTEEELRSGKVAAARTVLATLSAEGGRVRLGAEDAQAWLRALNDVRLALGVVMNITEDYEDELEAADWADPRSAYLEVYHWLGYVQDSLVRALS